MKMKSKKNMYIIIGIIIIVILCIITYNVNNKKEKIVDYNTMTEDEISEAIDKKINTIEINELADKDEYSRMKIYVSNFITAIENKDYEKAYGYLYEDYKKIFFPTINDFETYCKDKFPKVISVEYKNIERNGDIYVMWINMGSALAGKDSAIEMNFVVKENALNDFVLSFSVI